MSVDLVDIRAWCAEMAARFNDREGNWLVPSVADRDRLLVEATVKALGDPHDTAAGQIVRLLTERHEGATQ